MLKKIARLGGKDSKVRKLKDELDAAFREGYVSAIVFTQYTDTMDFLKEYLAAELPGLNIATYSGIGGAQRDSSGLWVKCMEQYGAWFDPPNRGEERIDDRSTGPGVGIKDPAALDEGS